MWRPADARCACPDRPQLVVATNSLTGHPGADVREQTLLLLRALAQQQAPLLEPFLESVMHAVLGCCSDGAPAVVLTASQVLDALVQRMPLAKCLEVLQAKLPTELNERVGRVTAARRLGTAAAVRASATAGADSAPCAPPAGRHGRRGRGAGRGADVPEPAGGAAQGFGAAAARGGRPAAGPAAGHGRQPARRAQGRRVVPGGHAAGAGRLVGGGTARWLALRSAPHVPPLPAARVCVLLAGAQAAPCSWCAGSSRSCSSSTRRSTSCCSSTTTARWRAARRSAAGSSTEGRTMRGAAGSVGAACGAAIIVYRPGALSCIWGSGLSVPFIRQGRV
jgi:hypothetical protein